MLVIVSHSDEPIQEFDINKFPIIIGRGNDADIVISSDNISRKHLEIQNRDNEIFIRDLTLSNWVSYNNEKLSKSEYIQYFDFAPLVLPSGHEINFKSSVSETLKMREDKASNTDVKSVSGLLQSEKKVRPSVVRHTKNKETNNSFKMLILVLLAFIISFLVFDNSQKSNSNDNREVKQLTNKEVREVEINYLEKMLGEKKCATVETSSLCDFILTRWSGLEGIVRSGDSLFVFKNFNSRLSSLFPDKKIENPQKYKKVIAALKVVVLKMLKDLSQQSVSKVYIVLYNEVESSNIILNTYLVETKVYSQMKLEDYKKAYLDIVRNDDLSIFNMKIAKLLNEKMELK